MLNKKFPLPVIEECETKVALEGSVLKFIDRKVLELVTDILLDLDECESPIEQLMSIALTTTSNKHTSLLKYNFDVFEIERQKVIEYGNLDKKKCRVDFLVTVADQENDCHFRFIIECDGYEFHSSKERFESDRKRDRNLLSEGFITLRFSGKEILENPEHCAYNIFQTICKYIKINKNY